jgi:hypothetical protein
MGTLTFPQESVVEFFTSAPERSEAMNSALAFVHDSFASNVNTSLLDKNMFNYFKVTLSALLLAVPTTRKDA